MAYFSSPAGAVLRIRVDEQGAIADQQKIRVGDVRVRGIRQGPDGFLYVLTHTTEQLGEPGLKAHDVPCRGINPLATMKTIPSRPPRRDLRQASTGGTASPYQL